MKTAQIFVECPLPMNFDTYRGCSHACVYCFANNANFSKKATTEDGVIPTGDVRDLERFVNGKRDALNSWCDWDIPICLGRMSDPFQPCEKKYGNTLRCLKWLARKGYPFVFTTKSSLMADDEEYLSVLKDCNCVAQISMLCSEADKLEPGAAKYEDRLRALEKLSPCVPRTIARWQPFFAEFSKSAYAQVPRVAAAGAYGILEEVGIFKKKTRLATNRINAGYTYPHEIVLEYEKKTRALCHEHGLRFLCGDNKTMSDELPCCTGAGLESRGFIPCKCNAAYYYAKRGEFTVTDRMREPGSACVFHNLYYQRDDYSKLKKLAFADLMKKEIIAHGGYR